MILLAPFDIGLMMGLLMAWAVLGLALGYRLLDFPDLTIEGSLPLGAATFTVLLRGGAPMIVAVLLAVLSGALAGALTGFLHVRFRVNKFLSGIIVVAISYSLCLRVMGSSNIGMLQSASIFDYVAPLDNLYSYFHFGTNLSLAVLLLLTGLLTIRGLTTRVGLGLRVAGSNPNYAKSIGINVQLNVVAGLAATNGMAALSGVLMAMHQGFVDVGMGQGILILALAAMTLGERLLPEEKLPFHAFVFLAAVFGSVLYQVLVAYAVRAGLNPTDLKLTTAVLVLAVVAFRVAKDGDIFSEQHF